MHLQPCQTLDLIFFYSFGSFESSILQNVGIVFSHIMTFYLYSCMYKSVCSRMYFLNLSVTTKPLHTFLFDTPSIDNVLPLDLGWPYDSSRSDTVWLPRLGCKMRFSFWLGQKKCIKDTFPGRTEPPCCEKVHVVTAKEKRKQRVIVKKK